MTSYQGAKKPKVLWLTNLATPYRIPLWKWLNQEVDLTLGMLRDPARNRFGDWDQDSLGVKTQFYMSPTLSIGRRAIYFPNGRLKKALKGDFDVFVLGGWESPAYFYALWIAKRKGIRVIGHAGSTSFSSEFSGSAVAKLRSWFHRQLDFVVSYGTEATKFLVGMGVAESKISTAFNSVDNTYFYQEISKLNRQPVNKIGHNFIFVGRLMPLKNIANIILAFNQIKQQGDTLRIIGRGKLRDELVEFNKSLDLESEVQFVDHKEPHELIQEYAVANTLILASTTEVWGLVVNEALVCGLNVVVSYRCGVSADIAHMDGVYISGSDSESIASKMNESREHWSGPRENPAIIEYTIERYGKHFLEAINR
ncbi:MAG: glycosyltransferase [Actinobacteria bacterium]|nr:glycosyltransferase [Actinomycetota bacterium]NBY15195.1 glycosyltransferase [Actinomycetota bacterium]